MLQTRQNTMPHAITHVPQIAIALVFPPALSQPEQIGLKVFPPDSKQRANDRSRELRAGDRQLGINPRQPTSTSSTHDLQQHRFGLIVQSVPSRNPVQPLVPVASAESTGIASGAPRFPDSNAFLRHTRRRRLFRSAVLACAPEPVVRRTVHPRRTSAPRNL